MKGEGGELGSPVEAGRTPALCNAASVGIEPVL